MYAKVSQMIGEPAEVDPQMLLDVDEAGPSQMVGEPVEGEAEPDAGATCPACGAKLELVSAEAPEDAAPEELPGEELPGEELPPAAPEELLGEEAV